MPPKRLKHVLGSWARALLSAGDLEYLPGRSRVWEQDAAFTAVFQQIRSKTLVDAPRCFMLYQLLLHTATLQGSLAEVGVYRGGTAYLMTRVAGQVQTHLFDTFRGMPAVNQDRDLHSAGDFDDTSLQEVRQFVGARAHTLYHQGVFPESARNLEKEHFRLVHVDCDIYESVASCCQWFYPRLEPGGVLLFDDYGFASCPGARAAVDEFFQHTAEKPLSLMTGQALVVKQMPIA